MEILLISYGDLEYDGRLRSLLGVFSKIGNVHAFTRGITPFNKMSRVFNCSYIKFISESIKFASEINEFDWLVLDNRKATIPGLLIRKKFKSNLTIQDCRELYISREVKHFIGKVGCIFEKMMIKRADVIICANQERARIMKEEYALCKEPIVYENLRKLEYESNEDKYKVKKKIDSILHEGEYRIISTSGCSSLRTNDILVNNIDKVKHKCRVYLVGVSTQKEIGLINDIVKFKGLSNIEIISNLNQSELKYLISKCHIGIVNYGQYDTNNKFCASGKLYEFLYEGLPVVTTSNPPLNRICKEGKIGCVDDEYYHGINEIIENYEGYVYRVKKYTEIHTTGENDKRFLIDLLKRIKDCR